MSLKTKLLKTGSITTTGMLDESEVYNERHFSPTQVPNINVALSGDPFGGVSPGLVAWCGPSRHFKTMFCLICAKAYLDDFPDAMLLFYDSEFGSPPDYFKSVGIDPSRVIHVPITNYEELRSDIAQKLEVIEKGERVFILVDSLGNLASSKEVNDAINENDKADFTRAKINKSLFRIVTPHLRLKSIPMHVVQHTYDTMEMYSKKVVAGGQGTMLAADNVFIIGRQQEVDKVTEKNEDGKTKSTNKLDGYNFTINVEKSRYVKEKSKIDVTVSFSGGIKRWSGVLELALEGGFITKLTSQSYCLIDQDTGEVLDKVKYKKSEIEYNGELWKEMFKNQKFVDFIKNKYMVSHGDLLQDETIDDVIGEDDDE